jgi:16S rRNA (cytidine1402-2'-O)-methyltransferase
LTGSEPAGSLVLVATPIGNLGDLSPRAVAELRDADVIAAEDTRRTRTLLTHAGIPAAGRLRAVHAHNEQAEAERLVGLVREGARVVYVSDAGTPGVSDPGERLVRACVQEGLTVEVVPGPSAVLAALVASGLAGDGSFRFVGFLPRKGSARRDAIAQVCATPESVVLFEAPGRLGATLRELADATPDRPACVARELTKLHEELVRGTCAELAADVREWLGEIAVVLGPCRPDDRAALVDDAALDVRIDEGLARGEHARGLAERLAAWSGRSKRVVYERVTARKGGPT